MSRFQQIIGGRVVSIQNGHAPQFLVGLDASKPSAPGKGDTYYATDTIKIYNCFRSGIWTCVSSPCYVEYINDISALDAFFISDVNMTAGGSAANNGSGLGFDISSGTTGTGNAGISKRYSDIVFSATLPVIGNIKLHQVAAAGTAGTDCQTIWGFTSTFTAISGATQRKACFTQDKDNNWFAETSNDASSAKTQTAITRPTTGAVLTILVTTGVAVFFVNGAVVATHTTNLPDNNAQIYFGVETVVIGSAMSVSRDITIKNVNYKQLM